MRAMKNFKLIALLVLLPFFPGQINGQEDLRNSQDHPVISRYPGQTIRGYDVKEFDTYNLVLGVDKTGAPEKIKKLEGKVTRIYYRNPAGRSTTEIIRNFEDALRGSAAQILFSCAGRECGTPIRWTPINGIRDMGGQVHNRYVAARAMKDGTDVFVSVFVGGQSTVIDVVELKPMEAGLVTVNADALAAGIDADGHIAVYAILFDTGKSTVKAESKAAIAEIAKLLKSRMNLKLFVVGHTDSTGEFESNMKLSRERAAAVTQSLITEHGIAATRVTPHGVGPLAPVASNTTGEGRARNRRVELVVE